MSAAAVLQTAPSVDRKRDRASLKGMAPMHSGIKVSRYPLTSPASVLKAGELVRTYSWGKDYPVDPADEIRRAEFGVGAWVGDKLVGFAGLSRAASPDGINSRDLWFGYAVVLPAYRRRGVFRRIYDECLRHMRTSSEPVFSCSDNPLMIQFLVRRGWRFVRATKDESGSACLVFELPLRRRD